MGNTPSSFLPVIPSSGQDRHKPIIPKIDEKGRAVPRERIGESMMRVAVGSKMKLGRSSKDSKLANKKPVQYIDTGTGEEEPNFDENNGVLKINGNVSPKGGICATVDDNGHVRVNNNPSRKERAEAHRLMPQNVALGTNSSRRALPPMFQEPITHKMLYPREIPADLEKEFNETVLGWDDLVKPETSETINTACVASKNAYAHAGLGSDPQKSILSMYRDRVNQRILPTGYTEIAQKVISHGFSIRIPMQGRPSIITSIPLPKDAWSFDNHKLLSEGKRIEWQDEQLLDYYAYGCSDSSSSTPPITCLVDASPTALRDKEKFDAKIKEEIDKGWYGPPTTRPTIIPFQNPPGGLVAKKSSAKLRLIWNASHPRPDQKEGMVQVDNIWFPISPNYNTKLPQSLRFHWTATHDINNAVDILACAALLRRKPLLGTTIDLKSWFRTHALALTEQWKSLVLWNGEFREDFRMQMGRASAAHTGQRTSYLIVRLIVEEIVKRKVGVPGENGEQAVKDWIKLRNEQFPGDDLQSRLYHVSVFQDDITLIAVGEDIANQIMAIAKEVIASFGVELSEKEEATKPFSQIFDSIGATYDITDLMDIKVLPTERTLEKAEKAAETFRNTSLIAPREDIESAIGSLSFVAKFIQHGRALLNSIYATLRPPIQTKFDMVHVSQQAKTHAAEIIRRAKTRKFKPIIAQSIVEYLGEQALTCDASGSLTKAGWGLCFKGVMVMGVWPEEIRKALRDEVLSISHLELATTVMLIILHKEVRGSTSPIPIVAQNDNETAVNAANSLRAKDVGMAILINKLVETMEKDKQSFVFAHIPGTDNKVADSLSRNRWKEAERMSWKLWNTAVKREASTEMLQVVETVRQSVEVLRKTKQRTAASKKRKRLDEETAN